MAVDRVQLKQRLIEHQSLRLRETYGDFAEDSRYRHIADFFFTAIYSSQDKSKRDADFKELYEYFQDKLGMEIIRALGRLVDLNTLTNDLDELVVDQLQRVCRSAKFSNTQYEQAYRDCDNHDARVQQIKLILDSVRFFHEVSHWRSIGLMMKVIRLTARLKGATEMGDFIQQGFEALRTVKDVEPFLTAVNDRELERLNRIWKEFTPARKLSKKA